MVLNKVDMMSEGTMGSLAAIVAALNPLAQVGLLLMPLPPFLPPPPPLLPLLLLPPLPLPLLVLSCSCCGCPVPQRVRGLCACPALARSCPAPASLPGGPAVAAPATPSAPLPTWAPCPALPAPPQVKQCSQGAVPIQELFGRGAQGLVSKLNIEGQHRWAWFRCWLAVGCR